MTKKPVTLELKEVEKLSRVEGSTVLVPMLLVGEK